MEVAYFGFLKFFDFLYMFKLKIQLSPVNSIIDLSLGQFCSRVIVVQNHLLLRIVFLTKDQKLDLNMYLQLTLNEKFAQIGNISCIKLFILGVM